MRRIGYKQGVEWNVMMPLRTLTLLSVHVLKNCTISTWEVTESVNAVYSSRLPQHLKKWFRPINSAKCLADERCFYMNIVER